jgi:hypothetical protein
VTDRDEEEILADAIIRYLAERPAASDTVEGIAEWWLSRNRGQVELSAVAGAIKRLLTRGLLEEVRTTDPPRYRRKR